MFTDELAGNPAKKRADEAKARRIRAKREKEAKEARKRKELERRQKEEQEATLASSHEVAGSSVKENPPASSSATSAAIAVRSVEKGRGATEPDAPLNAAQKAAEQRRIRAEARAKIAASKTIQSCVRSKLTASKVREQQRNIYDKRMSDLIALTAILKRSSTQEYVPPPATVSIMTTQFLFFACPTTIRKNGSNGDIAFDNGSFILEERDLSRWTKLVNHLLLPGILDTNLDLDPLLPWVESANGRKRLNYVLTLLISSVARRQIKAKKPFGATAKANSVGQDSNELLAAVDLILRALLRLKKSAYTGGNRDIIHQKVCSLLIKSSAPSYSNYFQPKSATANIQHQEYHKFTPDLISSLRSLLLFGSNGVSEPIPPDAERMREDCMAKDEKCRADVLTKLIIDFIACMESGSGSDQENQGRLCSRFVSEILTVPLFTWKVNLSSYESLIQSQGLKPPPLVDYIRHFNNTFTNEVSDGRIAIALNMTDISLSTCPAPPVLCLLSNVIQIGNKCDTINGTIASKLHYTAAAEYFNFVATLINVAPLGTFSSKMSAVEWVSNGSTSSPIVLSNVVIEQAAVFLSDSFVRSLFNCAIDDDVLMTRKVIDNKTEKDMKQENDLTELGSASVTSLAAKEAMVDRNRRFWQSSKWAKKLSNFISSAGEKMTSSEASAPGPNDSRTGKGKLMNTSSLSRQLANGKGSSISRVVTSTEVSSSESDSRKTSTSKPQHVYSASFFFALCRAYGTIISRLGGNGKEDLVRRVSSKAGELEIEAASAKLEPCVTALLNVLCFSTNILSSSWAIIQSNPKVVSDLYCVIDVNKGAAPIRTLTCHNACGSNEGNIGASLLLMFVTCLSHTLMVTDDVELHEMEKPLPKHQVRRCILLLKKLLYRAVCLDDVHNATKNTLPSNHLGLALISVSSKVMNDLYSRSSRRLLCVPKLWIEEDLLEQDIRRCKSHLDYTSLLASPVCRICPFLVSFKRRLKLFERIVTTNRIDVQGSNEQRNLKRGIMVKVQRGRVLEDGLIHLNNLGRNMRQRICVNYISDVGTSESGVDVGGLFKEFWTDLSALAFDPNYALFKVTEDALMYPNPSSKFVHGGDMSMKLFEFLGRILGKALYEGITIQPQFAHLFLSFLKGDHSYLHLLTDLSTIDTQLYNNLMFLKTYEGDAADLCLTFTVANDDFGVSEQNLIPNGADIEVTNGNKRRYIYLVAKHHVCDRIKEQADAFCRGLWEVIDRSWLRLFNEPELQVLISGASDGKIDVSDMKANSKYTGGYSQLDRNVIRFWSVVSSLTPKQQADLLRFVTSCERPPPLGFASMSPPFTIQRVGIMRDGDKLPSASTCFNTLKLPTYSSEKVLKERLIYAIESKSGFELT